MEIYRTLYHAIAEYIILVYAYITYKIMFKFQIINWQQIPENHIYMGYILLTMQIKYILVTEVPTTYHKYFVTFTKSITKI